MELWAQEDIDLVGPAFIELGRDRMGRFAFIAVEGQMDCRDAPRDERPGLEFSWEGRDDCDPASGRGWAALADDGSLYGHIYFHAGDDSSFRASGPRARLEPAHRRASPIRRVSETPAPEHRGGHQGHDEAIRWRGDSDPRDNAAADTVRR